MRRGIEEPLWDLHEDLRWDAVLCDFHGGTRTVVDHVEEVAFADHDLRIAIEDVG